MTRRLRTQWALGLALALLAGAVLAAFLPWRLASATARDAVGAQLSRLTGLDIRLSGPVTFKLLPRPRIQALTLSAARPDGTVRIDVPAVRAEFDIPSLARGAWRLTAATLVEPTVTVDVDRANALGLAPLQALARPRESWPLQLRLRGGVVRLLSSNLLADTLLTEVDVAASWPANGDGATLSGTMVWRGGPAQFAAEIEHTADLAAPSGSAVSMQWTSPVVTLSANGALSGDARHRFAGRAGASVPSLSRLLGLREDPDRRPGRLQIAGDVLASLTDISVANASLRLDRSRFEGTMAVHRDGGRIGIEGTLATDLLDADALMAPFAGRDDLASLYRRPLLAALPDADVDLRLSASSAQLGRVALEDAAVAVLSRGPRLEVTVDDARLSDGHVKGRAVATRAPTGFDVHVALTAAGVDVAKLGSALGGQGQVGGALSGTAQLDGRGASLREIVASLDGRGQVAIADGWFSGLSVDRILRRFGGRLPFQRGASAETTAFARALWGFSVSHGDLAIENGTLTAPNVALSFSGETRLPDGRLHIRGEAVETDASGSSRSDRPRLPFDLRGSWDSAVVLVGMAGTAARPSFVLPLFGPAIPGP